MIVKGRLFVKTANEVGLVNKWEENPKATSGLLLKTCLAKVDEKQQVPICCINRPQTPIVITAGGVLECFM